MFDELQSTIDDVKRDNSSEICGKYFRVIVHIERYAIPMLCGDREKCDKCRNLFVKKEKERIQRAIENGYIRQIMCKDVLELNKLLQEIDHGDTRRYPCEDGQIILLVETDEEIGDRVFEPEDIDWDRVSRTPRGKRVSGTLGKKLEQNKQLPEIQGVSFTINATLKELEEGDKKVSEFIGHIRIETIADAIRVSQDVIRAYRLVFGEKIKGERSINVKIIRLSLSELRFSSSVSPPLK